MKFIPRKPREGINVSDVHPLTEAGTLVLGLSAIFAAIVLALVFFVDLVLAFVSTETEVQIFSTWTPDDLISTEADDVRESETRALVERLARHWPDSPYKFRLEVSESETPNAMALPGGLIIVTTALLDRVGTENEFAFVLGHEFGHFRNRDHIRQLGRGVALGILFAALRFSEGGGSFGIGIADLTMRGFSRKQESDADSFGLEIVYAEYGHVDESWRFFDRTIRDDYGNSDLVTYFSTHPSRGDRIENLKFYARQHGWPLTGPTTPLTW